MNKDIIKGIEKFIQNKSHDLRFLNIQWFGGEPLLAANLIEELSKRFMNICEKNKIHYTARMTTNGYLLNKNMLKKMINVGVTRYQITIDGPSNIHDQKRMLKNGHRTYKKIITNLRQMHNTDLNFEIIIRVNIDGENIDYIPELIDDLKHYISNDHRFRINFQTIRKWGSANDPLIQGVDLKDIYELFKKAKDKGFNIVLSDILRPNGSICYAGNPYSYVIGSDGAVYKCTVLF